jgi:hypothetical protein
LMELFGAVHIRQWESIILKQCGTDFLVGLVCRRQVFLTDWKVGPTAFQYLSRS